jgi:phospholipase C
MPANSAISHVFVLMLENRSFDHMLGFSGITGTDAETKKPTKINGLTGTEFNSYEGIIYQVQQPADFTMPVDPGHEFLDTVVQLTDTDGTYTPGHYPPINNSGFVKNYITTSTPHEGHPHDNFGEIMKCYSPSQLPILNALAKEFAVCDSWFSAFPGPTWPNRFFLHAASSAGLDHTPKTQQISDWEGRHGFRFQNGSIFDKLKSSYRLYRGDRFITDIFPNVSALKGINFWDAHPFYQFADDINSNNYDWKYTFIEPSYGDILHNTYLGGNSQHPLDDVTRGESLIKEVYETIRNSPIWNNSLLIITWDEHGGFYDHVAPPKATPPGDATLLPDVNSYGFTFDQYGVRVPAVVVSPYIPQNTIDHRVLDHTSVLATLENLFNLTPLTKRDQHARSVAPLLTLTAPRDTPTKLPDPAVSGVVPHAIAPEFAKSAPEKVPVNIGNVPGFLHAALKGDLELSPKAEQDAIMARFKKIKSMKDAEDYMHEVKQKAEAKSLLPVNQR